MPHVGVRGGWKLFDSGRHIYCTLHFCSNITGEQTAFHLHYPFSPSMYIFISV